MNVLIAHSERNSNKLTEILQQYDKKINIIRNSSSLQDAVHLLSQGSSEIDLAILSLQKSDLSVSELINNYPISNPVIFTSNSKEDAYEAIKANGVDFVLEPFDFNDVTQAVIKTMARTELNGRNKKNYKQRFIIKFGDKIQYRSVTEISYIYAEGKMAYIMTKPTNRKYIIEYSLDELEKRLLNPDFFYRINRKFIVNVDAIEEARHYVNSRLKLILNPPADFDMVVSREKVVDFKNWLNL